MRTKASETVKSKPALKPIEPSVTPARNSGSPPALPSNPLQPASSAPGEPHAVAPETAPTVQVEETPAVVPPYIFFGRPEDEASEPHWIDPITGFPDTRRRRDGSLFSTPKA